MTSIAMIVSQFLILSGASLAAVTPQLVTISSDERNYFTAAVFEHARLGNWMNDTPADFVAMNLDYYDRAAEVASSKGADIISFPEYGFFPYMEKREHMRMYLETIPDHKLAKWNPCRQTEEFSNRPILRRLSCIARDNGIVVVSTMGDVRPCTKEEHSKCPDDGFWHHNAIVAFDRDGILIGVSRKEHLFFEGSMDLPPVPQDPFFTTEFGNFAMYICFDSVFKSMAIAGRNSSIDAVILSPMWGMYLPLLTSIQHFSSWAIGNEANLIVSNVQIPRISTGSGIFAGKMGALKYTFSIDNQSKLIVARLPKHRNQNRNTFYNDEASITVITSNGTKSYDVDEGEEGRSIPNECYYQDANKGERCFQEPISNYTFKKLIGSSGVVGACNNGLCCSATYDAVSMNESFYLGVFNGSHNAFDRYFWCKEVCFVVRCDNFNGSECNTFPAHSGTVFRKLELNMNLTTDFVYPSVLKSGFRLAPVNEWNFSVVKHNDSYSGRLTYESDSDHPMINAALKGRCYDRDPPYIR